MNYYALYLNGDSDIESYLALIRYICNPKSKSLPHITLFTFSNEVIHRKMLETRSFSSINIVEAGTFNFEKSSGKYVVYLRCESKEIDSLQYKPNYPSSRLHLTLYEGEDYSFAKNLFDIINDFRWHFMLRFQERRKLVINTIGRKKKKSNVG